MVSERELPEAVLQAILRRCDLQDVGRCACVDRRWSSIASNDFLWQHLCAKHLHLSTPSDHHGNLFTSYKNACKVWHENFRAYPFYLVVRAKKCWESLRTWASSNYPKVANSLLPGVSEEALDKFEERLGWKLPPSVRLLYRFCGGQDTAQHLNEQDDSYGNEAIDNDYSGLFGGYSFYDHTVNVHFLSLHKVLLLTQYFISQWGFLEEARKWVIVAASVPLGKFFLLNCQDGSLHVGTRKLSSHGEVMSCVAPPSDGANMQDAMLRWFEVYISRLNSGMYSVQRFDGCNSICLYPELQPFCSQAVSNGVQVRSSAVFVPEYSTLEGSPGDKNYFFAYAVRMRKLADELVDEDCSQRSSCNTCQLSSRHWIIYENGAVKNEVHGSGVIGKYPLLETGGSTFVYASCSPLSVPNGSIEGDFTFVAGSLTRPEGPQFKVKVAGFPLEFPSFIY